MLTEKKTPTPKTPPPDGGAAPVTAAHIERLIVAVERLALAFLVANTPATHTTPASVVSRARTYWEQL